MPSVFDSGVDWDQLAQLMEGNAATTANQGANLAQMGTNPGSGNWFQNIISQYQNSGAGNALSLARILGNLGSTALGAYGSNTQANALRDISASSAAERAPFLNAATGYLNNPASYFAGPGRQSLEGALRALSVNGNPFGNPTSLAMATEAGLRDWRNAVTGFGNMGLSGQDLRAQLDAQAAGADRGITTALASGLGSILNPQPTLMDYLRMIGGSGLNVGEYVP